MVHLNTETDDHVSVNEINKDAAVYCYAE